MTEQGGTEQGTTTVEAEQHAVVGKWSAGEVMDSLTGVEEDAVEGAFGAEPVMLQVQERHTKARRAMIFVLHMRDGANPAQARQAANALRSDEVFQFFADVDDEDGDSDPESEPGKDAPWRPVGPEATPTSGSASDFTDTSTTS